MLELCCSRSFKKIPRAFFPLPKTAIQIYAIVCRSKLNQLCYWGATSNTRQECWRQRRRICPSRELFWKILTISSLCVDCLTLLGGEELGIGQLRSRHSMRNSLTSQPFGLLNYCSWLHMYLLWTKASVSTFYPPPLN